MPPFASFWTGRDIADRRAYGFIDEEQAGKEDVAKQQIREALIQFLRVEDPHPDALRMLRALLEQLRDGPARLLLVNLEDLWAELEPQNVPSTAGEDSPNWRRKARYPFEEFSQMPQVLELLREVGRGFEAGRGGEKG
jgi:4-alpha-glucanotransferase